jgi:DNA-binding response OmpR family regulator
MPRILVVEDDASLRDTLRYNFERSGYEVTTASSGRQALDSARHYKPDAIVLDVMLPELDGLEVCRELRRDSAVPILMLTARDDEVDKIVGLEIGADDYMTKPFSVRELLARVKVLLRRVNMMQAAPTTGKVLELDSVRVDINQRRVTRNGEPVHLKLKEFELLAFLMQEPGRVFTRDQLLNNVWGYDFVGDSRTVDVHVRWLREKLEESPSQPVLIETVRGVGYRFRA